MNNLLFGKSDKAEQQTNLIETFNIKCDKLYYKRFKSETNQYELVIKSEDAACFTNKECAEKLARLIGGEVVPSQHNKDVNGDELCQ